MPRCAPQAFGQTLHALHALADFFDLALQQQRLGGRLQFAAHAQEQREPQLHLGMLQDFAHRRLRDMQQLGGGADGAGLANSLENFDVAQAHGGSP